MDIILIILVTISIGLSLANLLSSPGSKQAQDLANNFDSFTDRMDHRFMESLQMQHQLETKLIKQQMDYQESNYQTLKDHFNQSNLLLQDSLKHINNRVSESLEKGFESSNKTFTDIVARLTKIDETQKKIDALSGNITSLQDVLTDKKTRGIFGEVQLNSLLSSIFGEKNDSIYQLQYSLKTNRVDAILLLPQPLGLIPIDSKFPLENYRRMVDSNNSSELVAQSQKQFVLDCKKHIDDIANKYIIPEMSIHQAIMFIPAEAIFATIHAYHPDIIHYAQTRNVWLVSPTTLMSTLTTIQVVLKDLEQQKHAAEIKKHLHLLSKEFQRYQDRWDKLSSSIRSVSRNVDDISITSNKISQRFEAIQNVEIQDRID